MGSVVQYSQRNLTYPTHIRPRDKFIHVGTFRLMSTFFVHFNRQSNTRYFNSIYATIQSKRVRFE